MGAGDGEVQGRKEKWWRCAPPLWSRGLCLQHGQDGAEQGSA